MTPILLIIIFHKINGKDFLVEVADTGPLNSEGEQLGELLSNNFENESKPGEANEEKPDTFAEELQKLEAKRKSGNDYMSNSMAKEGRCEGDKNLQLRVLESFLKCKVARVFHENMFLMNKVSSTRSASIWGLL